MGSTTTPSQPRPTSHPKSGELSVYLDNDTVDFNIEGFKKFQWWHAHKLTYPVLSKLARDVLIVPNSTVSSEFAFSLFERILEKRRTSLTSEMVKILLTVKDWEQVGLRTQHSVKNPELSEVFENMYLDNDNDT